MRINHYYAGQTATEIHEGYRFRIKAVWKSTWRGHLFRFRFMAQRDAFVAAHPERLAFTRQVPAVHFADSLTRLQRGEWQITGDQFNSEKWIFSRRKSTWPL